MLTTFVQTYRVNMISLSFSKLRSHFLYFVCVLICIFRFTSLFLLLTKQILEQQIVNWYFGKVFIENVMRLVLLYFCTHTVYRVGSICGFSISKTTYGGVDTVVKVLGSRWVDRHPKVINSVIFFWWQDCTHVYHREDMATFIKTQKAFIFLNFYIKTTMMP
jgi:hypothetical protein